MSPFFKHFFSKLMQSTSETISLSLETGQCKISQLMTPDTSPSQVCQQNLPAPLMLLISLCTLLLFLPLLSTLHRHLFTKRLTVPSPMGLAQVPVPAYYLTSAATSTRTSRRLLLPRDQQSAALHFTVHICCSEETGKGKKQKRWESNHHN